MDDQTSRLREILAGHRRRGTNTVGMLDLMDVGLLSLVDSHLITIKSRTLRPGSRYSRGSRQCSMLCHSTVRNPGIIWLEGLR